MPIYRYRNLTTNETFDLEQRITASALTHHPETGDPVKRLIQPVGIAFKGSGFYVNDSRASKAAGSKDKPKDGAKDSAKGDKAETKTEGGKTESKADSSSKKSDGKSATKTESKRSAT